MDFDIKRYRWMTLQEIVNDCTTAGVTHTRSYTNFIDSASRYEKAFKESDRGFEKKVLKKFFKDPDNKYIDTEILEVIYYTEEGNISSIPRLVKKITPSDYNSKTESWGIDDEILISARKLEVEDIQLVDEYNGVHFYTTLSKYNDLGEGSSWGKVYLHMKHFRAKKINDKIPFYAKSMRMAKQ